MKSNTNSIFLIGVKEEEKKGLSDSLSTIEATLEFWDASKKTVEYILQKCEKSNVPCIILINAESKNSLYAVLRLKSLQKKVPIITYGDYDGDSQKLEQVYENGADDFVFKFSEWEEVVEGKCKSWILAQNKYSPFVVKKQIFARKETVIGNFPYKLFLN